MGKIYSSSQNAENEKQKEKGKEEEKENDINDESLIDLVTDSYCYGVDYSFIVVNSLDNNLYLIYCTSNKTIISYNLIEFKKIIEIRNSHENDITNFRYFSDKNKKTELLLSSSIDNNVKIWKFNIWECILDIKNINTQGNLYSACFLSLNEELFILTSNIFGNEPLKVFDFNGNQIKEISESIEGTFLLDIYYDKKLSKNYIITGNTNFVKSYDYDDNKLYHKYDDNVNENNNDNNENDIDNDNDFNSRNHYSVKIKDEGETIKLIESSEDGNVRIWNFHTGELINKFIVSLDHLFTICLWKDEYLFVACGEYAIKLLNLENGDIIEDFYSENIPLILRIIEIPKYGECLLFQDYKGIKLRKLKIYK